jgi:hypothetical protein
MGLANDLAEEIANYSTGPKCSVGILLASLDKKDREALEAAFANPDVPASVILRAIQKNNKVAKTAPAHHKSKACACFTPKNSA